MLSISTTELWMSDDEAALRAKAQLEEENPGATVRVSGRKVTINYPAEEV